MRMDGSMMPGPARGEVGFSSAVVAAVLAILSLVAVSCSDGAPACSITITALKPSSDGSIECSSRLVQRGGAGVVRKLEVGNKVSVLGESAGGSTWGSASGSATTQFKVSADLVKDPGGSGKPVVPICFQVKEGQTYELNDKAPVLTIYELVRPDGTKERATFELKR